MRAFAYESFESAPASLIDIPEPTITATNQVLVKVNAASINAYDTWVASAGLKGMMDHEFPVVVGSDYAGTVEAVGESVTRFKVGDEVFGTIASPKVHKGSIAEKIVVADAPNIVKKPEKLDFAEAASLGLAGTTGVQSVEAVEPKSGQTILVVGATGGVGSVAVQRLAESGATVIATGKPEDEKYLKGLGATHVVDYSGDVASEVKKIAPEVDAILDFANQADGFAKLSGLIRDGGRAASPLSAVDVDALAQRDITGVNISAAADQTAIERVVERIESGKLRPIVQHVFKFDEVDKAFEAFQTGHKQGKIVLAID